MRQDIIALAREAGIRDCICDGKWGCLERFAELVAAKEREACEHDMEVLMNALWKACGDDAEVVNATIESQGELTRARGEKA